MSAALITAVATFGVSLLDYMTRGAVVKYGEWHVGFQGVDAAFAAKQEQQKEVEKAAVVENIGYAGLEGSKNESKPYLFVEGYSKEAFDMLPVTMFSGRMPKNSNEVIVSGKVAADAGVKISVGDSIALPLGTRTLNGKKVGQDTPYDANETFTADEERTYKVVGICQKPQTEGESAPGYTVITVADSEMGQHDSDVYVKLKQPREAYDYAKKEAGGHSCFVNTNVLRFMGISKDAGDKIFNTLLYAIVVIVMFIIMTGSVFLIYNSFHISLNERMQQFGMLMSIGATEKQLRNSVLFEGLCIGIMGIPIGVLTGIGGIHLVIDVVAKKFNNILYTDVPLKVVLSAPALIAAVFVSFLTILISAYIPARKAVRMPVMECIRQTNEIKVEEKTVRTSKMVQQLFGLEGTLAQKNFKRNKKRYRSIIMSLVLSVVLFVSASSFVNDMKQMSSENQEVSTYDIAVTVPGMEDREMLSLYDKLKAADGVNSASYQAIVNGMTAVPAEQLTDDYRRYVQPQAAEETVQIPLTIEFLDDTAYFGILEEAGLSKADYYGEQAGFPVVAKVEHDGKYTELFKNTKIELPLALKSEEGTAPAQESGTQSSETQDSGTQGSRTQESKTQITQLTKVDIVPPDMLPILEKTEPSSVYVVVMAPYSMISRYVTDPSQTKVKGMTFLSDTPTKSAKQMETILEGSGVAADYSVYNLNRLLDENRNYIFIVNVFSYTFILMISLIAMANVFNTISTNIKLRRKELAMLRSVGMSEHDFQKMMNYECAFYGIKALLIGLPLALICSVLIHKGMVIGGLDEIKFTLPWVSIGVSICSVLLIVFITMLYAVSKIKKENIIDSLRDDMS